MTLSQKIKRRSKSGSESGFTILELIIATTVFGFVLLIVTTGFVRIGQIYYKNLTSNRTQEAARSISQDIASTIQLSNGFKVEGASANQFCVDTTRYTFNLNQRVDGGAQGLRSEKIAAGSDCKTATATSSKELLSRNMRLLRFDVGPTSSNQFWKIDIRLAYGDNEFLTHYNDDGSTEDPSLRSNAVCKSTLAGDSFCATSQLDTVVKRRLNSNY